MAVIKAFAGALGGTFADLWRDIITAGPFTEHTVVVPGIPRGSNNDRGSNEYGSEGIITNGSRIYVPENTAAFIFSETGIENVITESGGYEYRNGEQSVLAGDGIGSFFNQVADRFTFGGQPGRTKYVAFVNLREIRGIKFGTSAPLVYNDRFYGVDLEIRARGSMSLRSLIQFDSFVTLCLPLPCRIHSMMKGHVGRFCLNSYSRLLWPSICCPMNIVFRNCLARRMTSQHACVAIGPMRVRGMIVLALKCPVWASKVSSSPSNHVNSCSSSPRIR